MNAIVTPSKTQTKTIRFSKDVIQKVSAMAKVENRSFANMVETILKKYAEEQK